MASYIDRRADPSVSVETRVCLPVQFLAAQAAVLAAAAAAADARSVCDGFVSCFVLVTWTFRPTACMNKRSHETPSVRRAAAYHSQCVVQGANEEMFVAVGLIVSFLARRCLSA